ncbi:MAG: type II and III secretion system protein family protein [Sphingomonadaceae bacterium]
MVKIDNKDRWGLGAALAAALAASLAIAAAPVPAAAQAVAQKPVNDITVSVGAGRMVRLAAPMTDLFVANSDIADVQVRSATQLYIFGKKPGETTVYATNRSGQVVYEANVRVGNNIDSIGSMLSLAMPEAKIDATPMNGMILLTGTVADPADIEDANRLVQAFVGEDIPVISRLKTATPLQVNLRVKIAEVSRSLIKDIGVNLASQDRTGGFRFGVGRGRNFGQFDPDTGDFAFSNLAGGSTLAGVAELLGIDLAAALDLAENDGLVVTLAEPNLTALSGETASFLAGGEFPIATSDGIGGTNIEFKEFGVSLAFTPIVLEDGRISMRVRPEVSELSDQGAIRLDGISIPALTTRRAETTVELGSGQSFMIGGLLSNSASNSAEKAPFLGDIPILGALFRSNSFRRNETELVIIVTPYLVKPMDATRAALPTDGYRAPTDAQRILRGDQHVPVTGQPPRPRVAPQQVVAPAPAVRPVPPAPGATQPDPSATPGFSFD